MAVVEERNFTRAAEPLAVAQLALSGHIQVLESDRSSAIRMNLSVRTWRVSAGRSRPG
ncbi:LysR family transcriptional regulator [Chenggangzhangella methanolivorans]|uniref:LysR family transcriptional regulator n=1 Tax=Chenggangzhangella methanolivorans TaxID=1437009 RepID=A0A9E6RIL8_9HYPH|nr:LysR family transcriptional regulator [Chenggangzhangella methanolivorans]